MPYVYLVPGDDRPGRALCFLPEDDFETAARITTGQALTLECSFQEYIAKPSDPVIVFHSCVVPN